MKELKISTCALSPRQNILKSIKKRVHKVGPPPAIEKDFILQSWSKLPIERRRECKLKIKIFYCRIYMLISTACFCARKD